MAVFEGIVDQVAMLPLYAVFLFLAIVFKFFFLFKVFFNRGKNLSTLPGPRWAALTRFWIVKALASGRSAQIFVDINKRYGEYIPNEYGFC